jgi:RNA polymerase sigma-70 factor (ECF subfamily)
VERHLQDRLHAAVLAGHPTAPARVFNLLLEPLIDWLGFRWRNPRDFERVRDVAVDSIIGYLEDPTRYNQEKASLLTYLRMDAHGDLVNDHKKSKNTRELLTDSTIELEASERNSTIDEYPSDRDPPEVSLTVVRQALPDERDRRAVLLLLDGERSTAAYAEVWGLTRLAPQVQVAEVKRHKDRLKARLRRLRKSA